MYENDTAVVVEEEDAIMPEGWQEGDDIFSEADSSLSGLADESGEEEHDEAEQDATTPQSQAPTTEPEEENGGDSAETDEQNPQRSTINSGSRPALTGLTWTWSWTRMSCPPSTRKPR